MENVITWQCEKRDGNNKRAKEKPAGKRNREDSTTDREEKGGR